MAAELGGYEQAHTSPLPLTAGNSRVVESPASLEELGSRAQAVARFRVRGLGRRGSRLRLPPNPHCTSPLRFLLQVVGPQEIGPTSLLRAEPGRAPWGKTRPPGARMRAPTPGLAPGWGPGCAIPGEVTDLAIFLFIKGF
ncbi:hypothetical protein Q7C36_005219 [Tachysurus vachellii]|uniref:Uncharacterized protein n=1 Tax=Tachysurus vachellii TaxID=175792 RepID=A0AA88NRE6_TACVA|nr:hypothetical protein Q7C36_005219 [Tachysurus vachellii]